MKMDNFNTTELSQSELKKIEGGFVFGAFLFGLVIGIVAAIDEASR